MLHEHLLTPFKFKSKIVKRKHVNLLSNSCWGGSIISAYMYFINQFNKKCAFIKIVFMMKIFQ